MGGCLGGGHGQLWGRGCATFPRDYQDTDIGRWGPENQGELEAGVVGEGHTPETSAFRLRPKDLELRAILDYILDLKPSWAT